MRDTLRAGKSIVCPLCSVWSDGYANFFQFSNTSPNKQTSSDMKEDLRNNSINPASRIASERLSNRA